MQRFIKAIASIMLSMTAVFFVGCNKENAPIVVTTQATNVTFFSVTIGGSVTSDGGSDVIERGICWGRNANPDVSTNVSNAGLGVGSFSCTLMNLQPATTYYARAYACNSVGVSYGAQVSFTTLSGGGGGGDNPSDPDNPDTPDAPETFTIEVSANPTDVGTVTGGGTFQEGETCTVSATPNTNYTFANWTENGSVVSSLQNYSFTVTGNRSLFANFTYNGGGSGNAPTGAINGKFTINANGDQVYFSQGNLQYQASTQKWQFATNQYDCIGDNNSNISSSYSGWIDLFGWGTSGWNSGANFYQPWSTSTSSSDYYPGGSDTNNLTGSYANADWGVYNAISNGGNQAGQWRTLTGGRNGEWYYIFYTRPTSLGIRYANATVAGMNGVILLPDDWNTSTYSLSNTDIYNASFVSNVISAAEWTILENAGAIFLPAAGFRQGTSVSDVGSFGFYWSSSYLNSNGAWYVDCVGSYVYTLSSHSYRYYGLSVRLVCPAQ